MDSSEARLLRPSLPLHNHTCSCQRTKPADGEPRRELERAGFGAVPEHSPAQVVLPKDQTPKDADGVFGPDYLWISNDWWDTHQGAFTLSGHQYWAGTKDTSRTSTWGILVGEYTITIPKNGYCSQGR
jgi:hypothetical protein